MNPLYRLLATSNHFSPLVLRWLLAAIFAVHAGQKTLGWPGGAGWTDTLAQWTAPAAAGGLHLPYPLAMAGILAEGLGALGLCLGFLTRLAALAIFCVMAVAILAVHWRAGFFAPGGWEYPLTLAGVALALMLGGGGRWSVDRVITGLLLPPNPGIVGSFRMEG